MELFPEWLVYTTVVMNHLRKFLICLLMLAVPMQGYAAAGMLACTPGQVLILGAPSADNLPRDAAHDHASHEHTATASTAATPHGAHMAGGGRQGEDSAQTSTQDSQFGTNCSVCAACCLGAGLLPSSILPGAPDFSTMTLSMAFSVPLSHLTEGLLRPPPNLPRLNGIHAGFRRAAMP